MTRSLFVFAALALTIGCGAPQAGEPQPSRTQLAQAPAGQSSPATEETAAAGEATASDGATALPDLRTRRTGEDWPQFLGPLGTSVSRETGIANPWPKSGPPVVWQKRLGEGYSAPVTYRGRLFQFTRFSDTATLLCLNAETGAELWTFEYPTDYSDQYGYDGGPRCCPVIDGERLYLYGPEGLLHCLQTADGKVIWKVDTRADFNIVQNFFGVGSTPVVYRDLLITMVGGSPKGDENKPFASVGNTGTAIVAFNKFTGAVVYKTGDDLASYASPLIVQQGGRDWCFAFARGGLLAFEPATGKLDFAYPWRAKILESVNAANPVASGESVLISECYGPGSSCFKFSSGQPQVIWEDEPKAREKRLKSHWCTPVAIDGYVYGCHGRHSNEAELRCLDLKTGEITWSLPGVSRSSLTFADGHFFCLGEYSQLRLFKANPEKYDEVSQAELLNGENPLLRYPCWAAPVISHGFMYLRGERSLLCLDLLGKVAGPPAPAGAPEAK
ncbi:MAG TPA: PQQ-binding-like beta-propeller repeat protein [Pirellulales bacterium]